MKKVLLLLLLLPLISSGCFEPPSDSLGSEYQISGTHGYIPINTDGSRNYPKFLLPIVVQFEQQKKVKVTSFSPQIDFDSEQLRGVWVTFETSQE
jgi:hypothetical protein